MRRAAIEAALDARFRQSNRDHPVPTRCSPSANNSHATSANALSIDPGALIARLNELPSLPLIDKRVHQSLCDPQASLTDVARIIETDHAMTARLLRAANRAQYGLTGKVDRVARALTVIGSGEALNLVLATSVISAFRHLPVAGLSMRTFWEHGLACAVAARTIATLLDLNQRDYLAGLLHDLGRLPLLLLEPHAMGQILRAHGSGKTGTSPPSIDRPSCTTHRRRARGPWRPPSRMSPISPSMRSRLDRAGSCSSRSPPWMPPGTSRAQETVHQ